MHVEAATGVDMVVRARGALLAHPTGIVGGAAASAVRGSAFATTDVEVDV